MATLKSPTTAALAALAFAALALGWYAFFAKSQPRALGEIDDDEDEEDFITAQDVTQVFDRLFLEMQAVLSQLMQQIQQIQMAGGQIPEKQLKGLLRAEMERALLAKQRLLLQEMKMDLECLEEATWEFLEQDTEYPSVKKSVERFQKLWENATGEHVVGWRKGQTENTKDKSISVTSSLQTDVVMSPEKTIQVAEQYFEALTDCMRQLVTRFKAEGRSLQDPVVQQQLNLEFAQSASDAGETALNGLGISLDAFEASVKAHANNANVGRALAMIQMKQQQDLMEIGSGSA